LFFTAINSSIFSASLSSMESETEDPFTDSTANLLTTDSTSFRHQKSNKNVGLISRRFSGTSSTHSLNETDYQVWNENFVSIISVLL